MTKADCSKPPTKLETITLKAFIHCEGCRRKIRRIIRVLDGVEDVLVDSATGKVTVTGAGLDVKIILQRLQKYGKQAEVWPSANAVPLNATAKSAGGSQPKPSTNNNNSPDTTSKKKSNPAGESGGTKPMASPSSNESKKGGGKKEEAASVTDQKREEAAVPGEKAAGKSKPEKSKESPDAASCPEAGDASTSQQNGGNGGGGGKKGKKGGNGGMGSNGPNGGGGGGGGGGSIMPELPPPQIAHDRPIASIPTTSITVSANKGLAPHDYIQTGYSEYNSVDYATHIFSDENANNCSIM